MSKPTLFFDDGGVMNDNSLRGSQWQRHVGEFFAPRLGGDAAAWAEANAVAVPPLWQKYAPVCGGMGDPEIDFNGMWAAYQAEALETMARHVGCDAPLNPAERNALMTTASRYVTERVLAAFPGVIDALKELHAKGYILHTASNEISTDLDGYLTGMGVRDIFPERLYGSDLLGIGKGHVVYYERLFTDAGVSANDAVVVDDRMDTLACAASVGARTVLIAPARPEGYDGEVIASVAALWPLL